MRFIVANPGTGVKGLRELVERGKREPGKLAYASAGMGSPLYLGVRMIEAATGARFNHIPYKGVGPAYQDLIGGRVDFMLTDLASVRQYIDAGKVVALAVTDKTRLLPNVPTPAEGGVPGITAFTSFSVMVPAKTQPALVNRIAGEIQKAMKDPALVHKLEQQALVPVADTPEQFAASLKEEQQNWGTFIKQQNIQPE